MTQHARLDHEYQAACRPAHEIESGVPGRTRTDDLPLRRRTLYPLSYGDTEGDAKRRA